MCFAPRSQFTHAHELYARMGEMSSANGLCIEPMVQFHPGGAKRGEWPAKGFISSLQCVHTCECEGREKSEITEFPQSSLTLWRREVETSCQRHDRENCISPRRVAVGQRGS
jgi:hypothetical protein